MMLLNCTSRCTPTGRCILKGGISLRPVLWALEEWEVGVVMSILRRVSFRNVGSDKIDATGPGGGVDARCAGCAGGGCTYGGDNFNMNR
jgi:hypothetical protein